MLLRRMKEVSAINKWMPDQNVCCLQLCCRCAFQMPERLKKSKPESRSFKTSRDLTVRRSTGYLWNTQATPTSGLLVNRGPVSSFYMLMCHDHEFRNGKVIKVVYFGGNSLVIIILENHVCVISLWNKWIRLCTNTCACHACRNSIPCIRHFYN